MGLGKMSNYTKEIDPPLEVAIKQTKRKKFKVNLKLFFSQEPAIEMLQ